MGATIHLSAPLVAAIACWLYLVLALKRASIRFPLLDVGLTFASVVLLYTVLPLLSALVLGDDTNVLTDNRMLLYRPSAEEIGDFMWTYVGLLAGFVAVYPRVRGDGLRVELTRQSTRGYWGSVLAIVVALTIYLAALSLTTGVLSARSYDEAFSENVAQYTSLPLFLQQITGRLAGVLFAAKLALVMIIVSEYRNPAWRYGGFAWLMYEFMAPFIELGSRSNSLFVIFAFIVSFHTLVRPLSPGIIVSAALVLLFGFLVQGAIRSGFFFDEFGILGSTLPINEFQSQFATAYDIYMRREAGELQIPWQIYFGDYLRMIPQQLLPFEKIDQSQWYLEIIGYRGEGFGFMFGIISEGLIGFGPVELIVRGVLLAVALGLIHNMVRKRADNFMWICFYLWLCTRIYLSFRGSTFYWLSSITLEFLPFALAASVLRNKSKSRLVIARP